MLTGFSVRKSQYNGNQSQYQHERTSLKFKHTVNLGYRYFFYLQGDVVHKLFVIQIDPINGI